MKNLIENFKKIKLCDYILKITVLSLFILFVPYVALSANHYIRDGATGDGSSWSNAWDDLPSTLVRGDTYYIADGTYGSRTFNTSTSGSTYIYIKKATADAHGSDTGWDPSYGNGVASWGSPLTFRSSYWVFDGVTGGGPGSWDSGYGFYIRATGKGIQGTSGDYTQYIEIRHVEIEGNGDDGSHNPKNNLIYRCRDNWTISHCYLWNCGASPFRWVQANYTTVEYNYIKKNESTSGQHSEGISSHPNGDHNIIRYNIWEEIEGTGIIMIMGDYWEVYGNLIFDSSSNNGSVATWSSGDANYTKVYNNTFVNLVGFDQGIDMSGIGNVAYNNLFYNCSGNTNFGATTHDYDMFDEGTSGETNGQHWTGGSSIFTDYSGEDFTLSQATQPGIDLGSSYNTDMLGVTRGADGNWDRGAFEYNDGSTPTSTPTLASPTGLKILFY